MKRFFLVMLLLCLLLILAVGVLGVLRYGGVQGAVRRVRVAWAEWRPAPHPAAVPTPLPTPTIIVITPAPTLTLPPVLATKDSVASPAPSPTPAPTPTRRPSPTPAIALTPALPAVQLGGLTHNWQTWNNCGPATLAMHLSYFGSTLNQEQIRQILRPNGDDKNTSPAELAAFARDQGLHALVRVHGDADHLKQFLSNGLPVLVETWIEPKPDDGLGHYRVLAGYDDARQTWFAYDSFISAGVKKNEAYHGIPISYQELDRGWFVFNNAYLIIYDDARRQQVQAILQEDWDEEAMWRRALADALTRTSATPDDAFAWFNLGTDLTALARYPEAAAAYDRARQLGLPWRMLWYQFGPFRAYYQVGRYEEVLALTEATLATTQDVEELHYWRARALLALGRQDEARQALAHAVELNPNYAPARALLTEISQP